MKFLAVSLALPALSLPVYAVHFCSAQCKAQIAALLFIPGPHSRLGSVRHVFAASLYYTHTRCLQINFFV
jgi:hypothetical protein